MSADDQAVQREIRAAHLFAKTRIG